MSSELQQKLQTYWTNIEELEKQVDNLLVLNKPALTDRLQNYKRLITTQKELVKGLSAELDTKGIINIEKLSHSVKEINGINTMIREDARNFNSIKINKDELH